MYGLPPLTPRLCVPRSIVRAYPRLPRRIVDFLGFATHVGRFGKREMLDRRLPQPFLADELGIRDAVEKN